MKRLTILASVLLIMVLLAACAGPATPAPASAPADTASEPAADTSSPASEPAASAQEVLIGYTASNTGKYNVESDRQVNGFNLWMKQVNDAGGIDAARRHRAHV